MWRDLQFSLRILRGQPLFAGVMVFTLALGIGGTTAMFSVFDAVLLRDLPYPDARQLYLVRTVAADGTPTGTITPRELRPFYEPETHPTVAAAAVAWSQEVQIIGADQRPHPTTRYGVTDQFFEVFGTRMALGKAFERGQPPGVVILAHAAWRDLFGSDPDIIGRVIQVEGGPRQVVGVTPEDFEFPENPGFWYLMSLGTAYDRIRGYRGFVRLHPGRTGEQFQSELARTSDALGPDPATNQPSVLVAQPFRDYVVGDLSTTVKILFGATGILLLIACINVANLLLSRTGVRAREVALREAVGARRWRVVRQLLTEALVLSALGGALGVAAAAIGVQVLLRSAPPGLPRLDEVHVDAPVLGFAFAAVVVTGLLVGLLPAWRLARNPLRLLVNEAGRGTPDGPGRHRLLNALVVVEIALAVLLTVGAGLLVRSYVNLTAAERGFTSARVLTFFMFVPGRTEFSFKPDPAGGRPMVLGSYQPLANFLRELRERIGGLPGVETVASTSSLPLAPAQYDPITVFHLAGDIRAEEAALSARTRGVSPGFFEALGIRLLAGRALLPSDRASGPGVAVVNDVFVRRFLAGRDPLGVRLRYPENPWRAGDVGFQLGHRTVDEIEIVGVVDDVKYVGLGDPAEPSIYLSVEQWTNRRQTLVVRTSLSNPVSLVPAIRREIESMDRLLTADFASYDAVVDASLGNQQFATLLLVTFGLTALALAAVGVYGLMSYSVAQRTGEIAVRSALGASKRELLTAVLGRGLGLAAVGTVIGIAGAAASRQIVAGQLYGLTALDPRVFATAALILFGAAALACFLPARRATRVNPADLFRTE
jgi:predicted permease